MGLNPWYYPFSRTSQLNFCIFSCFILSPTQFQKTPLNFGCSSVGTKSSVKLDIDSIGGCLGIQNHGVS